MVVNSHLSIHDKCNGFTSCSRTSATPSIVLEFLGSTSCGITSARGHGAIVYCLNSGSEERQTGRYNMLCVKGILGTGGVMDKWVQMFDKEPWRLGPVGSEFKKRICQSKYYDEESVKCLLGGILEEKREEREKQEIKEFEERRLVRERELERENRTTEVSEPVNKCRPLINPVVNKSVENATSCDFEKKNCDPPVRWTNVSHPSEVKGRGTEKNNLFKIVDGKEINVNRSSGCDVKMKVGVCEGRVRTVAMGAQRVINPDNIGVALMN
ncbi:hypothetical protein TNCV_4895071 [Trichonephila clavipes]|nr:hypothetical protein TNCV_4895071 [Trichonephila clavipes]